ncbi:16S rRNA methyltransferase [beta proteobacterium AAP99]|nr:16S rRNA methyltransferase [beta proteobacterium AAP99]
MKHVARKRFGQNFLTDEGIIHAIVRAIRPQSGEVMIEIGPGQAALTRPLIDVLGQMHAVEIDRDLAAELRRRFEGRLTVHEGDALEFDFAAVSPQPLRIVGNLPYNISSPLLFHLMRFADRVVDQHFMLQKEVVERMVGEAGSKEYGRLSVMLQARYWMEPLLDVPPESFDPAPKVDSAVVRMIPKKVDEVAGIDFPALEKLLAQAFSQRRKMLRNTLAGHEAELEAVGIAPTARAEEVALAQWLSLLAHTQRGV